MAIERERIRTNLVSPMSPSTPSTISSARTESSFLRLKVDDLEVEFELTIRYVADVPITTPKERNSKDRGREENDIGIVVEISWKFQRNDRRDDQSAFRPPVSEKCIR